MDLFERLYIKAARFLSYRPRSEKEVRDNLLKKQADPALVEEVIALLTKQKFLNDTEFVRWWLQQRTTFKPKAKHVLFYELKQKGIKQELIESVMANNTDVVIDEFGQALKLAQKKYPKYKGLPKDELYRKLGGFLGRRGYSWDIIRRSIDEVQKNEV